MGQLLIGKLGKLGLLQILPCHGGSVPQGQPSYFDGFGAQPCRGDSDIAFSDLQREPNDVFIDRMDEGLGAVEL